MDVFVVVPLLKTPLRALLEGEIHDLVQAFLEDASAGVLDGLALPSRPGRPMGTCSRHGLQEATRRSRSVSESKRDSVLAGIQWKPGLGVRALARATGMATDTIRRHARDLVAEGLVVFVDLDGALLHYPTGESPGHIQVLLDRHPTLRELLDHVAVTGRLKQARILEWGQARGWARSTVQARLKRLVAEGLVEEERVGGFTFYQARVGNTPASAAPRTNQTG